MPTVPAHLVFRGGDELRGKVGFGGVGRREGGDAGDDGVIAAGEVFRAVGKRRRQGEAQRADELPIGVGRKLAGEVGVVGGGIGGHGWDCSVSCAIGQGWQTYLPKRRRQSHAGILEDQDVSHSIEERFAKVLDRRF